MPPQSHSQFQTQVGSSLTVVVHRVARAASPLAPRSVATGTPGERTPVHQHASLTIARSRQTSHNSLCYRFRILCRRTAIMVHKFSSSVRLFTQPVSYCQLTALAAEATPRAGTSYNEKSHIQSRNAATITLTVSNTSSSKLPGGRCSPVSEGSVATGTA